MNNEGEQQNPFYRPLHHLLPPSSCYFVIISYHFLAHLHLSSQQLSVTWHTTYKYIPTYVHACVHMNECSCNSILILRILILQYQAQLQRQCSFLFSDTFLLIFVILSYSSSVYLFFRFRVYTGIISMSFIFRRMDILSSLRSS